MKLHIKGRRVPPAAPDESFDTHLARLEAMHTTVGGLLAVADQQADAIHASTHAHHDAVQKQIAALTDRLRTEPVTPELAQQYGNLLKQRKQLQAALLRSHTRQWDAGHTTPV